MAVHLGVKTSGDPATSEPSTTHSCESSRAEPLTAAKNPIRHHTHCQARRPRKSSVQISKCEQRKAGLQTEASAEHTSSFCNSMENRKPQDPSPPRRRKCGQFVQKTLPEQTRNMYPVSSQALRTKSNIVASPEEPKPCTPQATPRHRGSGCQIRGRDEIEGARKSTALVRATLAST